MKRYGKGWAVYGPNGGMLYEGIGNKGQIMSDCLKALCIFEHGKWKLNA
jgi:hypothetical protein